MNDKSFLIALVLVLCVSFISAQTTPQPFSQCIQVVNLSSGVGLEGLECSYSDFVFSGSMGNSSNGLYCVSIDSHLAGFYNYSVTCSDGSSNRTILGSFVVDEVFSTSPSSYLTNTKQVEQSNSLFVKTLNYLKNNPIVFISSLAVDFTIAVFVGYLIKGRRQRK